MERITLTPKDKTDWLSMRAKDATSTDIAALFNLSPYATIFETWHRKKDGTIITIEENERMAWGNRLEAAIAHGVAEDNNWIVSPMKNYMRLPAHRIGSSFDFSIGDDGILEIKNVDSLAYKNSWIENDDGTIEAPHHIELQVQTQLLVSGRKYAYIAALVGGNTVKLIYRDADFGIHAAILKKAKEFWESIDKNEEPRPDFERDFETIKSLYNQAAHGKIINADQRITELSEEYRVWSDQSKKINTKLEAIKGELLTLIGDSEKVIGSNFTISAGIVAESQVSYTRKSYRNLRLFFSKKETPNV
jgi:putative phage-type endonuclease